ncbi:MAG: methyltransferase [Hyphomonadaceae bacterium]|nr:methyltransferase [Hyphomonadaceae bacterium]
MILRQPAEGLRANADTLLLAASVETPSGARLLEAGCGAGGALLSVAARAADVRLLGVERDAGLAALAAANAAANGWAERVEIRGGDVLKLGEIGTFEGVFFNPPFDRAEEGRLPAPARRSARMEETPIGTWVAALADRLKGGATLTLIHRAAALADILAALEGRLGGVEIMPIRPRAGAPAKRVLVRARKGSRAPLRLYRGLDLHDTSGAKFSPEADALFCGTALDWS